MQKTLPARPQVNRGPVEVQDAAGAGLGGHIKEDFLKEAGLPVGSVTSAEYMGGFVCSRIRMEQLMSITQEETENLRRREIACEWGQVWGPGNRACLTGAGGRPPSPRRSRTVGSRGAVKSRREAWALRSG